MGRLEQIVYMKAKLRMGKDFHLSDVRPSQFIAIARNAKVSRNIGINQLRNLCALCAVVIWVHMDTSIECGGVYYARDPEQGITTGCWVVCIQKYHMFQSRCEFILEDSVARVHHLDRCSLIPVVYHLHHVSLGLGSLA